jgi:hypothetical protein
LQGQSFWDGATAIPCLCPAAEMSPDTKLFVDLRMDSYHNGFRDGQTPETH